MPNLRGEAERRQRKHTRANLRGQGRGGKDDESGVKRLGPGILNGCMA